MDSDIPAVVATFINRYEAEVTRAALEAAGITAVVQTDDAGGLHPHLSLTRGTRVVVRQGDLEAAQEVLADLEPSPEPSQARQPPPRA